MAETASSVIMNPAATEHLPSFVTLPGQSDTLMQIVLVFLVVVVFLVGILYLKLHALPEHIAHRSSKIQYEVVAILALVALFTHNTMFWIAALVLALIDLPDLATPLFSMARSLHRIANRGRKPHEPPATEEPAATRTAHIPEPAAATAHAQE